MYYSCSHAGQWISSEGENDSSRRSIWNAALYARCHISAPCQRVIARDCCKTAVLQLGEGVGMGGKGLLLLEVLDVGNHGVITYALPPPLPTPLRRRGFYRCDGGGWYRTGK